MAQQPGVIFVLRHGPRLDAADASWHLSTPTPYDPPITYGGWNQSRALGTRIATLLHAREQDFEKAQSKLHEFDTNEGEDEPPRKRRRLRHKVVIHSSPFLRCLQTSIAVAAGMAQYNPTIETKNGQTRTSSASPRSRTPEGTGTLRGLSALAEPSFDFAHAIARKALHEHKRYRKSKLRVDAFLGEWLNPSYFEGITAPPPSSMMVATAKAELRENETVEIFQPSALPKSSANSPLWGPADSSRSVSREAPLDDWSPVEEAMPPSPGRSRANTENSPMGNESGRKSPFRPGSPLQPLTSSLPKQELSVYHPPTPQYAVSQTHQIPRGYVVHARDACTNVDLQWDSSRSPHSWVDGGQYGEEWSQLHKRMRKGVNSLVQWYSEAGNLDAHDDPPVLQLDGHSEEDEKEDLVVILVTHGAGCNALIGALTGQPVLLDVGMASLTMAVRRDDAPPLAATQRSPNGRRGSQDLGLSTVYEMKLVASTEHLRPGAELRRAASPVARDVHSRFPERLDPPRSNTNSTLGSIRRPSATPVPGGSKAGSSYGPTTNTETSSVSTPKVSTGLWAPPPGGTPKVKPQARQIPIPESGSESLDPQNHSSGLKQEVTSTSTTSPNTTGRREADSHSGTDTDDEYVEAGKTIPPALARRLSQQRLWGSKPSGAQVSRLVTEPKRRWTVEQDS